MFYASPNENRERYQLMLQRRQALLELAKLKRSITTHDAWLNSEHSTESEAALAQQLFSLDEVLCKSFCQADCKTLHSDLCKIYRQLIILARVWLALERQEAVLELLVDADHG